MPTVPTVSKTASTAIAINSILLATSGDTLTYVKNKSQELWMFNTSSNTVSVTIDGDGGNVVVVPGTGGSTVNVANGLVINIPANGFSFLPLDRAEAFLAGQISITASAASAVKATVVNP